MVGTSGPRMLRLTARYADAWNAEWANDLDRLRSLLAEVDAACSAEGRDPATLARTASMMVEVPGHARPGDHWMADLFAASQPAAGSPVELAALLRAFAADGVDHVQVWLDPNTEAGIEAFAPVLDLLDRG